MLASVKNEHGVLKISHEQALENALNKAMREGRVDVAVVLASVSFRAPLR